MGCKLRARLFIVILAVHNYLARARDLRSDGVVRYARQAAVNDAAEDSEKRMEKIRMCHRFKLMSAVARTYYP